MEERILNKAKELIESQEKATATAWEWHVVDTIGPKSVRVFVRVECQGSFFGVPLIVNIANGKVVIDD